MMPKKGQPLLIHKVAEYSSLSDNVELQEDFKG